MRRCVRAIIINDEGKILVFERYRQSTSSSKLHHYYSIPGGGIEAGEEPAEAVVRELREEMMVLIRPKQLLVHQIDNNDDRENYYFWARIVSGTPIFNQQSEEAVHARRMYKNSYTVVWADLDDPLLTYYDAYGKVIEYVKKYWKANGFPTQPVDMRLEKT